MKIHIVQAEHPFSGPFVLHAHVTQQGAEERALKLAREIFEDFWEIYDGDGEKEKPLVTAENWREIVKLYGDDEDFVQTDGWGRWAVWIIEEELHA